MTQVSFKVQDHEMALIKEIAKRADRELFGPRNIKQTIEDTEMDLCATIAQGVPLRLQDLLDADAANFGHDLGGIRRYIDRQTGKLRDFFVPRYYDSDAAKAKRNEQEQMAASVRKMHDDGII
jgi:hypothetical protein